MNFRAPKKHFLVFVSLIFLLSVTVSAQGYETVTLIENSTFDREYTGFTPIFIKSPRNGIASIVKVNGEFTLYYTPDSSYVGLDSVLLEYKTGPLPRGSLIYVAIEFDVRTSILIPKVDYHLMYSGSGRDTLDVLINDSSSTNQLELSDIILISQGQAGMIGDSLLWYEPDPLFAGTVQLEYKVCDNLNTCALGQLIVTVVDTSDLALRDTIIRSVKQDHSIDLLFPGNEFEELTPPDFGDLDEVTSHVFRYTPDQGFTGVDSFSLSAPGQLIRDVFMHVLPYEEPNDFLLDDEVYLAENVTVEFDVQQNDVIGKRFKVKNFTTPDEGILTFKGNGVFEYEPVAGFSGLKTFTYTVCPSNNNCETAEVRLFVSNSKPENTFNYKFNTLKNVPLVVNYQVPIDYFDFDENLAPINGALDIYDGYQTVIVDCDTITGNNLVIYYPDTDFHGQDEFELTYSIPQTGYSAIVKVEVNVINADPDSTCACINGCVWPGDVDYDGRVTVKDLLPLGFFMGEEGPQRDSTTITQWVGQYCDDWDPARNAWSINPKHADTDGNGLINAVDTQAIIDHYYNEHNLVEKDISLPRKFPLTLHPLFTRLDSGETAVILVGIGTDEFPVYDLSGFTYSYFYDPDVVDSSSLRIDFHKDSWFTDQSPVLDLYKQPWDGRVDAGFTRTGGKVATGFGVVSTLSFGVEEDVEGIRKSKEGRVITVSLDDGYAMNGNGEMFRIPGASLNLFVTGKADDPKSPADPDKLACFPNPTDGLVQLFLNGQNHINSATVFNLSGQSLGHFNIGHTKKAELDLGYLHPGFYLLRVETTRGPIVKKIQVLR